MEWGFDKTACTHPPPGGATDDLSRFRYHTGAALRRVDDDEFSPVLFRDIGADGMELFLTGKLRRLAGPYAPITYIRSSEYSEPYTDFEQIGRLVILQSRQLGIWHSGVDAIYVAPVDRIGDQDSIGWVPGDAPLATAAQRLQGVATRAELREVLGGGAFDDAIRETRSRLTEINCECGRVEQLAGQATHQIDSLVSRFHRISLRPGSVLRHMRTGGHFSFWRRCFGAAANSGNGASASAGKRSRIICSRWRRPGAILSSGLTSRSCRGSLSRS